MEQINLITEYSLNNFIIISIPVLLVIIGLVYFFKLKKSHNTEWKLLYFVVLIFFSIGIYLYIKKDQDFNNLKKDYELSIGIINKYIVTKAGKGQNGNICEFDFQVGSKLIKSQNSSNPYTNLPNNKPNLDINYLVIYQKNNPENNFILLNYPIKDSLDFFNYKKEFKNAIPEKVFKN